MVFGKVDDLIFNFSPVEKDILNDPVDYIARFSQRITDLSNQADKEIEIQDLTAGINRDIGLL